MIRVRDVKKSFSGKAVLKGLNLDIFDGEILVIVGRSGHGKSVLLKHFIGLMKPDSGEIFLDDHDMTKLKGPKLYNALLRVGMIFQMGALFDSMTVFENVAFYLREHGMRGGKKIRSSDIPELVENALKMVGLEGTSHLYPQSLSGGMKKRASVARSIVFQPSYLFYDEPTTGLDPVTAELIADLILQTHKELNGTTVVVSHDIVTTLYVADRIALIENGVIEVIATPTAFMKHNHPTINLFNKMIGHDLSLIRNKQ